MKTKLQYLEERLPDSSLQHLLAVVAIKQMAADIVKERGNNDPKALTGRTLETYNKLLKAANDLEASYAQTYDTYLELSGEHARLIHKLIHFYRPTPPVGNQTDNRKEYDKHFKGELTTN